MTVDAKKAFQYETEFLSALETNFETAKGVHFRGSTWQAVRTDDCDRLRALLASNRRPDRELLKTLPANRRLRLTGFERRLLFWKRRTGVAIASVLSPLSHYAKSSSEPAPPVGLGELVDHVRQLAGEGKTPKIIGVCSPSGFTADARDGRIEMPHVTVVLIEPDGAGGWRVSQAGEGADPRVLKIFDPENADQKVARVQKYIEESSADLLTGGLSVAAVARKSGLPEDVVRQGFEAVADAEPELRLAKAQGDTLLFRGAMTATEEKRSMNMIDRIRQMFSGEGEEAAKINLLAERRAALSQRRDRIYEDIAKFEAKEAELFEQGKNATSSVPKRRIAAQLNQVRKDVARQNTVAAMLNQQINVLSTDIHNLTLIQQGTMAKLPDTTELTENAVKAEEMLESLKADVDMVSTLETAMETSLTSDEELAILREFEDEPVPATEREMPAAPVEAPSKTVSDAAPEASHEVTRPPSVTPPEPNNPNDAEAS